MVIMILENSRFFLCVFTSCAISPAFQVLYTVIRDLYFFFKNGRLFFQFEGPFHDGIVFVDFLFKKFQAVSDKAELFRFAK